MKKLLLVLMFLATFSSWAQELNEYEIQNGIKYQILEDNASIIGYDSSISSNVDVPSKIEINGTVYPVSTINISAFKDCTKLTSITIPNSISSIGEKAFWGCKSLTEIFIPNSVTKIENFAFANCSSLTKLVVGENLNKVGNAVLAGCSSLTEITWNAINCSPYHNISSGANLFYEHGGLDSWEFDIRKNIKSFKFGENVEHIPNMLCAGLTNVSSIEIPKSVKSIGILAFNDMQLEHFNISNENPFICFIDGIIYDKELTNVYASIPQFIPPKIVLPNTIKNISKASFWACKNLESLTFPENITTIGSMAIVNSGIKEIIWNVAKYQSDLSHLLFDDLGIGPYLTPNNSQGIIDIRNQITSLKFGQNVETIPENLYAYIDYSDYYLPFNNIPSIVIPKNVKLIKEHALSANLFYEIVVEATEPPVLESINCFFSLPYFGDYPYNNATVIVPPGSVELYKSTPIWSDFKNIRSHQHVVNGITYEEISETEVKVVSLDSVSEANIILPSIIKVGEKEFQVVEIEAKSFKDNDILKSITIPNTIRTIGAEAFMNCVNLEHVELPDSLTSIESHTFTNTALKNIVLPECITEINTNAFSYTKLGSIVIPENVSLIVDAFTECSELKDVVWNAKHPYVIGSLPSAVSKIKFGESVELIPSKLCLGLTELTEITLPNSVNKIEANAFDGCKYLNKVIIGSGVTTIESEAFANCDRISQIIARPTKAPEIIKSNAFTSDSYNFTELLVNYGYKNHYSKELYWPNFKNIVEESSPNHFEIQTSGINASRGGRFSIPLNLINEDEIAGFQADIYMPSGFSISTIDGEYDIEFSGRATTSHRLSYNVMSDGALRIIAYSPIAKTFEGKEGVVINLKVKVAENFNGLSNVEVKNVIMTSPENNEYRCSDLSFTINVKDSYLGNANGEGDVNISDVIATANYIVGGSATPIDLTNADVNCDYVITVADVVGISNIILGKKNSIMNSNHRPNTLYSTESTSLKNSLFIEDFSINKGEEKELCLKLTNNVAFSAFQADLYLPTGLNIINDFELTDRKDNHSLLYSKRPDGSIRILSYSETSRDFKNDEDAIVKFTIIADSTFNNDILKIKNIIFTQQDMTSYNLNDSETSISFSGVENIINNDSITVFVSNGEIVINGAYDAQIAVYNLNGSLIYRGKNQSIPVVNRGVYIVKINDKVVKLMI